MTTIITDHSHLEKIAIAGIEQMANFDPETDDADTIYDDCYCAALDALISKGYTGTVAREVADEVARRFAQP